MANGIFKASFEWVGRRRGLPEEDSMQVLFEWFGGRGGGGGVVSASLNNHNNHIASENSIQFHSPVLPNIITQWR